MARRRVWKGNTPARYEGKLKQLLSSRMPPADAEKVASSSAMEYARAYGYYSEAYNEMIRRFGDRIPSALRGLYRSALFAMIKASKKGYPVEYVIEKFNNALDPDLLREIAEYFGLIEASEAKQAGAPA